MAQLSSPKESSSDDPEGLATIPEVFLHPYHPNTSAPETLLSFGEDSLLTTSSPGSTVYRIEADILCLECAARILFAGLPHFPHLTGPIPTAMRGGESSSSRSRTTMNTRPSLSSRGQTSFFSRMSPFSISQTSSGAFPAIVSPTTTFESTSMPDDDYEVQYSPTSLPDFIVCTAPSEVRTISPPSPLQSPASDSLESISVSNSHDSRPRPDSELGVKKPSRRPVPLSQWLSSLLAGDGRGSESENEDEDEDEDEYSPMYLPSSMIRTYDRSSERRNRRAITRPDAQQNFKSPPGVKSESDVPSPQPESIVIKPPSRGGERQESTYETYYPTTPWGLPVEEMSGDG
jgi:hypothetical protein